MIEDNSKNKNRKKRGGSQKKKFLPYYKEGGRKTFEDTKEIRSREDFAETEKIVDNGNFYLYYDVNIFYKFLWLVDGFITGLIYIITSVVLGWVLDDFVERSLNPADGKFLIFLQVVGQLFYIVLILYFIIYIYGKYLPNFCLNPPPEHLYLKKYSVGFFTIFGIFAIEPKLKEKLKYIFYGTIPST